MKHFGALYLFEWKKLLGKKIVWISFLLGILISSLSLSAPLLGNYYLDGTFMGTNYEMYQTDKTYAKELGGRKIDQRLLEETITAYRKIPETETLGIHYMATEEYQKYARPYDEIFIFIRRMTGMPVSEIMRSWQPSETDLYAKRRSYQTSLWEAWRLSAGEMDFWRQCEEQIKTPYLYEEHKRYHVILSNFQVVGLFVLLLTAICLSGIFTDEHTRKTDQIVLCSPLGKAELYLAKIAVGISFSAASATLYWLFVLIVTRCLYGTNGCRAAFQLLDGPNANPVTCGQAVLIAYGNMLAAAIIISVFVMVLSELLKSSIATLATVTGLLFLSMLFRVPNQYRVLAQIWDWLPWSFLAPRNVFGAYTISVFGRYFTPWQAVPVIYLAAGALIAALGKRIYQRFQVSGR